MTPARLGIIITLLATTLLGVTGALVYRFAQRTSQPVQEVTSVSPTQNLYQSDTIPTGVIPAAWMTHVDSNHDVEFQYPENFAGQKVSITSTPTFTSVMLGLDSGLFEIQSETTDTPLKDWWKQRDNVRYKFSELRSSTFNGLKVLESTFDSDTEFANQKVSLLSLNSRNYVILRYHVFSSNNDVKGLEDQILSTLTFIVSDQEKLLIDSWLQENNLNQYGDPKDRVYAGGTPLFDERAGERTDRYEYILKKHPERPWSQ